MKAWVVWFGFGGFVAVSGSRWLLATYFPSELPPILEQSLHELVIAGCIGAFALRGRSRQTRWAAYGPIALAGVLLLAVSSVVLAFARDGVSGTSALVAGTLVPVAMVFVQGQRTLGFGAGHGVRRLLAPSLAGVAGALLLIPMQVPGSMSGKLWLFSLAISSLGVAWASVELHRLAQERRIAPVVAVVFGASGLVTGAAGLLRFGVELPVAGWGRELLFCGLVDGPLAVLLVWLLRELQPVRLSSRFFLVPLVSVLEGMAIARVSVTWVTLLSGVLILMGAGYLLAGGDEDRSDGLSLR